MSRIWTLPFALTDDIIEKATRVRLAVFDVDGVLTDGSIIYGPGGDEYKTFHVRDGQGVKALRECGIDSALISARACAALDTRAAELGISHISSGVSDKSEAFEELLRQTGLNAGQCCYVGDDLVDLPLIMRCGLGVAVADAHHAVRHVAHWTTPSAGGRGAVREVCDALLYAQNFFDDMIDRHMRMPPRS